MGKVIMCTGKLASEPYVIPFTGEKLYSIEEICQYVDVNIYGIEPEFFNSDLTEYIRKNLGLEGLADKLKTLTEGNYGLKDLVTVLFCSCDLYDMEEILKVIDLIDSIEKMPAWERQAYVGYKFLKEGKYQASFKVLRCTLKEESLSESGYAEILETMGICLLHISSYKDAANYFYKSYRHSKNMKTLFKTLFTLKLGNLGKEFDEIAKSLPGNNLINEVNFIWERAEKKALNSDEVKEIEEIFDKIKSERVAEGYMEIENKLEEFKTEYREGASNGLIL